MVFGLTLLAVVRFGDLLRSVFSGLDRVGGWRAGLALAVALMTATLVIVEPARYVPLRDLVFDSYQQISPRPRDPASPVHIIDIDEASLAEYGQWPWPRTHLARLTDRLYAHGAVAIGFDILFPEWDRTSPDRVAESWRLGGNAAERALADALAGMPSHDALFAAALARGPAVLAVAGAAAGAAPALKAGVAVTGAWPDRLPRFAGALQNIPPLGDAATGIGAISLTGSADGVVRTVPLILGMGDRLVPALSVELLRVAQGAGGHVLRTTQASGEIGGPGVSAVRLRTGALDIPLEQDGHFRVHFAGQSPDRFTPVGRVLSGDGHDADLAARVAGRIVLIGASAQGLYDIRATPLDPAIPGVVVHAEVLEQIIAGHHILRPDWMPGVEVLLIALGCGIVARLLLRDRPLRALVAVLVLSGGAAVAGPVLFAQARLLFDPLAVALAPVLLFLPGAAAGLIAKERARRAIRARFAHFVPDDLLAQIEVDPDRSLTPQGSERVLTVMFIDMAGFSTATEGMAPDRVVTLVNAFLTEVSNSLLQHRATIDKFMGDAVMAFWNAPIPQPDHAARALGSLVALRDAAARASAALVAQGLPPISVRIGVNTGPASIGLMGSSARLSYTCLGDSVNLAARLEGLTRLYGVWNCAGPDSLSDLPAGLVALPLDRISVKGFRRAVDVATILPETTPGLPEVAACLSDARAAYAARDWDRAEQSFQRLAALPLDGCDCATLAGLYLSRLADWRLHPPPPDWDGSHKATSK